ncbi:hypothetical protein M569_05252 [Genlisea aurea]|uniref:Uncharacterized protein n=1 Tax=Genlisea aurea TaxID=192259 RepID=S8CQR1_9LAMI|nr:hypothetical protein M569_05252 [Genlisea aurea]
MLIIVPAICKEVGSPFGDKNSCASTGLSYVSFSMAVKSTGLSYRFSASLGAFFIWTYAYNLIRRAKEHYDAMVLVTGNDDEKTIPLIQDVTVDVASTSVDDSQQNKSVSHV